MLQVLVPILCICLLGQVESQRPAKVDLVQEGGSYRGKIHVDGAEHYVHLQPPKTSVFSNDFKLHVAEKGPNGEPVLKDVTPSEEELYQTENNQYVDQNKDAVFKVEHCQGKFCLNGFIGNSSLYHNGREHVAVVHENLEKADPRTMDYFNINQTIEPDPMFFNRRTLAIAEPELYFVVDYALSQKLGSTKNITEYLSMLVRMINNRYAQVTQVPIKFKIVGFTAITDRSQQPFMETNKCGDGSGAYDMSAVLNSYSAYMYEKQATLTKHDLSPLLSGEEWKSKNSDGTYSSGIAGLAWVGGACTLNTQQKYSYKCSVNADQGALWKGGMTITHELAHNLNCPHDGDGDSTSCSWENGMIMSYKGWGTANKFLFSSCCKTQITNYASSKNGACLTTTEGGTAWTAATKELGDLYGLDAQCQRYTKNSNALAVQNSTNPSAICLNLTCSYTKTCPAPDEAYTCTWTTTLNTIPYDNTPCGAATAGTKCWEGKCIKR